MQGGRKKICIVATIPFALNMFMKPHVAEMSKEYEITLIANGVNQDVASMLGEHVNFIHVDIARKISPVSDLITLFQLYRIFCKEDFFIVHSMTPKAGLLAMLAAFFSGVRHRIHTFTGQIWANKTGITRRTLRMFDKLIASFATSLLADSFSQRQFLICEQVVKSSKIDVLGNGSACGVDIKRFKYNSNSRHHIRTSLGIPEDAIVYLYLGRLNKDKGLQDLAHAFSELSEVLPNAHLLIVGPDEAGMNDSLKFNLANHLTNYHSVGFTSKPEDYMASADIFCLPSYREGFGSVLIEAAAVGLPAVASRIYGIIDAVVEGETGILHQPKNITEIKQALITLSVDNDLRKKMSAKAIIRAHQLFSIELLVSEMHNYYHTKT